MSTPHIVGLGNAVVDVVVEAAPETVARHGLTPGGMHLVDADQAAALFAEIGPGVSQSGGSVGNTITHLAGSGVTGTYLGKVAHDALGDRFANDMADLGLGFPIARAEAPGTGHCVIIVTPGGERTMSTYLGAAVTISPADMALMPAGDILFIEGYLFDAPQGPETIRAAAAKAKASGMRVGLTPSDAGAVERNREAMSALIKGDLDMLIGTSMDWALSHCETVAITQSEKGALLAAGGARQRVAASPVAQVVDTTGAGDAFAAGFLTGIALDEGLARAGQRGADLAAKVIGHFGARDGAAARALSIG